MYGEPEPDETCAACSEQAADAAEREYQKRADSTRDMGYINTVPMGRPKDAR